MLSSNYSVAVLIFSFWTSVMEDHQIEKLDQSYQIITALQEFLTTLNSPTVSKETLDTNEKEEETNNTEKYTIQPYTNQIQKNH